ncbi:MAG: AraC family transcriptional regulator [Sphingobacterium sp.]
MGKQTTIPINRMADRSDQGVLITRISVNELESYEEIKQAHRDDFYLFCLQEEGTTSFEIDFQKCRVEGSSVIYIRPDQVHRIVAFKNATISIWIVKSEHIQPEYLKQLENISPIRSLPLGKEAFSMLSEAITFALKLSKRTDEKLYHSLLKDSCNLLVGLVAAHYLAESRSTSKISRFEKFTRAFKAKLEDHFTTTKKPNDYAQFLHISAPYLNECVKNTTGHSVSYHIQQRVILEAKRLLYHSDRSVKQIAAQLGYDDYPYFSRLFRKVAGVSATTFRNRNLE